MKRIKEIREAKGMKQYELARKVGITAGALSMIESGVVDPRLSTLLKIAAALGVKPADLLGKKAA